VAYFQLKFLNCQTERRYIIYIREQMMVDNLRMTDKT
jgi:hypothetical protein